MARAPGFPARIKSLITLTAILSATVISAAPAHAHHEANDGTFGTSFVDGAWDYGTTLRYDFSDHRSELGNSLCYGCADSWNTDLVVMWQAILVAEGLLPYSEIDGEFGPITKRATERWQDRYDIGVDGLVGGETWRHAGARLEWTSVDGVAGAGVKYKGTTGGIVQFTRGGHKVYSNGAYGLWYVRPPGSYNRYVSGPSDKRIHFYKRTLYFN